MHPIDKSVTSLHKMGQADGSYVAASPSERVAMVWELTAEAWTLKDRGPEHVERRLQRTVAHLLGK